MRVDYYCVWTDGKDAMAPSSLNAASQPACLIVCFGIVSEWQRMNVARHAAAAAAAVVADTLSLAI